LGEVTTKVIEGNRVALGELAVVALIDPSGERQVRPGSRQVIVDLKAADDLIVKQRVERHPHRAADP
jgi:hypothetical protein